MPRRPVTASPGPGSKSSSGSDSVAASSATAMPGAPLTHHTVGSMFRHQPRACPGTRAHARSPNRSTGPKFDTRHPTRVTISRRRRLPFLQFYPSVSPGGPNMRRSPLSARGPIRRTVGVLAAALLLGGGVAACGKSGPGDTLNDFLAGWRSGSLDKVGFVRADGSRVAAADVVDQLQSLSGDLAKVPLVLTPQGKPKETGDVASGEVKLDWTL